MKRCTLLKNKNFKDLNPLVYGDEQCTPGFTYTYLQEQSILIHYVISGTGIVSINDHVYPVQPGEAFIRYPFIPITYTADQKKPWAYRWIIFDGELSRRFTRLPPVFPCSAEPFEKMSQVFSMQSMQEEYLASCLFSLYISLFQNQQTENVVSKVKNYLDLNFKQRVCIESVAAMVHLNRNYLSRLFRRETGMSMQTYLTHLRMRQAKEFLSSGMTVGEAAAALGYSDQFIFSKAVKLFLAIRLPWPAPKNSNDGLLCYFFFHRRFRLQQ